VSDNWIV